MRAADIMTVPVISVSPETSLKDAVELMLQHHVSGLPVTDADGRLAGVISEADLLCRKELGTERRHARWLEFIFGAGHFAEDYARSRGRQVNEVMTSRVVTGSPETPLETVVDLMNRHRIKRLPIVESGRLVGIVSRSDVLHALAGALAEVNLAVQPDDAALRKAILDKLGGHGWAPTALINVQVQDGEVELRGTLTDERERTPIRIAIENIPGVKAIQDHLISVEPISGTVIYSPDE
ncbi:BON domain-containing protein [Faunimonas pinastri]|uniref:BON domain-containing protein n=1 Tax=Faunimonas pinastri TaxID=1855383 RepID=A0A1H9PX81_9HYPH|nr:CBS domain-containing protein [Faunimonas pinastri]SER52792.1 BON domain-containing protein [Faunimonas pinastri]